MKASTLRWLIGGCFCLAVLFESPAQKVALYAGTQLPLKYDSGVEFKPWKKFSAAFNCGILTKPYDTSILAIIAAFGLEEGYVNMIANAFKIGVVSDLGFRYHHKRNYLGLYGQNIYLFAQDAPYELVESYLGVDIAALGKTRRTAVRSFDVALQSTLWQLGLLYGRRFELKNPHYELRLELSVSKNVGSNSQMFLDGSESPALTSLVDSELKPIYKDYAYVPTLNVYLVYKFLKPSK